MFNIGLNLRPNPDISIEPEYFYAGSEVIGGILRIVFSGTHHASSISDYESTISAISSLNGNCRSIYADGDCGSLQSLDGAVGFVEKVDINPSDVLNFQYSITLVVSKDNQRQTVVQRSSKLDFGVLPSNIIVNKYVYEESSSMTPLQKFSIGTSGDLTPVAGKITVNAELGVYRSNNCDSDGDDILPFIGEWLRSRTYRGISKIPTDFTYVLISEKLNMSEIGGSIAREYLVVPKQSLAIVTINSSDVTQQVMGSNKTTVNGSIEGIKSFSDAEAAYSRIVNFNELSVQRLMDNTCGETTPLPVDLCRILVSSKRTDNQPKKIISFDFTYEEVERCLTAGYRILTEYSETAPVKKVAEYIIPGKSNPIVFVSTGKTAERKKLKVSSQYSSCDESFLTTVKSAVTSEFNLQKQQLGLNGNYIRLSRSENEGRYSYEIEEEFIKCE